MRYVFSALCLWFIGLVLFTPRAEAVTAFARKYNQPCVTCHSPAPPRLNDFGITFKENGFYLEGGKEFAPDEMLNISELFPVSVRLLSWLVQHSKTQTEGTADFEIPHEVEVILADAFGPRLYGFSELEFEDDEVKIGGHAFGYAVGPGNIWLRAGKFAANEWVQLNLGSGHNRLTRAKYKYEDFDFQLDVPKLGSESFGFAVYGRPSKPFWFDIALLEGNEPPKHEDLWAHLMYTFSPNWNFSFFGYAGNYGVPKMDFTRLGGGVRWVNPSVIVYASYLSNSYDQITGGSKDGIVAWVGFTYPITEQTYADARWELIDSDDFNVDNTFFTFHIGHSLMQNVRTALEYQVDSEESDNNLFTWLLDVNI